MLAAIYRRHPGADGPPQRLDIHTQQPFRMFRQLGVPAPHQRPCASDVAGGVMVQPHGYLDQALQQALFWSHGLTPDVFQRLVGVKKAPLVEQLKPVFKGGLVQSSLQP